MLTSGKILNAVEIYVMAYLKDNLSSKLTFHNLNHTLEVVHAVKEIAAQDDLSEEQLVIIQIAAWFHDCGYAKAYTGQEDSSKQLANDFLKDNQYPEEFITRVLKCIEATRYPQKPMIKEARILCDADLYHFTKPDYHCYEDALRRELELYFNHGFTKTEWAHTNCGILENHVYFTDYGKNVLQKFKTINVGRMKCKCIG